MTCLSDQAVLETFLAMPGHRGCTESDLVSVESELGVRFPNYYRQLMLLDAERLMNTGFILSPEMIPLHNHFVIDVADGDRPPFVLPQVVFAAFGTDTIFAMECTGGDDSPVYEDNDSQPVRRIFDSLQPFFAFVLRGYFGL
jgi:hypothetical protein